MNIPKISKRLEAAASFTRRGVRFADVGTDHAYLPIYLCTTEIGRKGVASDINRGPVDRALANVRAWGVSDSVAVVQTDGLHGIEVYEPEDIFILGMGGELIVKIISEAEWLRSGSKRLILQPMTHPEITRSYLCQNGFRIVDECLVKEEKIYQMICAEYCGENTELDEMELLFGAINLKRGGELLCELLMRSKDIFSGRIEGKRIACADSSREENTVSRIEEILAEVKQR